MEGMKLYNDCDILDGDACTACRDYMEIEGKISAAKEVLNDLSDVDDLILQRSEIRSRINQNHDLLTRHVPVEVVCSVFKFCLPPDDLDFFHDANPYKPAFEEEDGRIVYGPLLLGSICKTWRTIAWRLQALWTVLRIYLFRSRCPHYIDLAREWLDRTGQLPLSILISNFEYHSWNGDAAITQLIALINERSKQWKYLNIFGSRWLFSLLKGDSGGAPNLQGLRIECNPEQFSDDDDEIPFSLTANNPRITHLRIWGSYELGLIGIEWDHLTNVSLYPPSLDDSIELLRRAPRVVSYHIRVFTQNRNQFPIPRKPIVHKALERLQIESDRKPPDQTEDIVTFFESFIFPNLKYLKIEGGEKSFNINQALWAPVVAHIAKSSPPLISLAIQYFGGHPFTECIIPILQLTPSLEALEILNPIGWGDSDQSTLEEMEEYKKLFQLLANPNNTESKFLPNLEYIALSIGSVSKFDQYAGQFWAHILGLFGPISDIRNPRRRPLKNLQVQFMSGVYKIKSEDVISQLLELRKERIVFDLMDQDGQDVFKKVIGENEDDDSSK